MIPHFLFLPKLQINRIQVIHNQSNISWKCKKLWEMCHLCKFLCQYIYIYIYERERQRRRKSFIIVMLKFERKMEANK